MMLGHFKSVRDSIVAEFRELAMEGYERPEDGVEAIIGILVSWLMAVTFGLATYALAIAGFEVLAAAMGFFSVLMLFWATGDTVGEVRYLIDLERGETVSDPTEAM